MIDQDILTSATILDGLGTSVLPRTVACYAEVSSTMDVARERLQHATAEQLPLLVLADAQTAGRGRMRRNWSAPPGSALLFSLALRPEDLLAERAQVLVWMTGVALCEGITAATGLQPRLKWPNDVMLPAANTPAGRQPSGMAHLLQPSAEENVQPAPPLTPEGWHKVAGILLEISSRGSAVDQAILGCGLNVSANPPAGITLRYAATNLSAALGRPVARLPLLRALLTRLDHWYVRLQQGEVDQLFQTWRSALLTLGHTVQMETADGVLTGYAEDVTPSGALRLRDATGTLHTIASGDINT
jgi:BirA family transcriptional regulator, biotin operon repressor / biotin---[acetyl-CoA-carboxylase] ligase